MLERPVEERRAYYEVLEYIFTNYNRIAISESTILDLHSRLLKYDTVMQEHRAKYKQFNNKVETREIATGKVLRVLVVGTPVDKTPQALHELVDWFNEALQAREYHPLLLTSAFIVEFLKIHPFYDGNGRVSRILTNLLLLKTGYGFANDYPHEKIIENSKEGYYLALSDSQTTFETESETILSWTEYFLNMLHKQAIQALEVS